MPRLAAIVNVRDGERFVREAVASLLGQELDGLEVVVVDDGSTDRTPAILASIADPRLRVATLPEPVGIRGAIHRALDEVDAPLAAHLDADDVALPGRLARQAEFLDRHPEVAVVGSDALYLDPAGRPFERYRGPTAPDEIRERLVHGNCLVHSSVTYRVDAVRAVGGYPDGVPVVEDYGLWLRIAERYELASIGEPLTGYRVHPGQTSARRARHVRRLADRCRREAWRRLGRPGAPTGTTWRERLRGGEGTLGSDLHYWAYLYERMGEPQAALRFALSGLVASPLDPQLWRLLGRVVGARPHRD